MDHQHPTSAGNDVPSEQRVRWSLPSLPQLQLQPPTPRHPPNREPTTLGGLEKSFRDIVASTLTNYTEAWEDKLAKSQAELTKEKVAHQESKKQLLGESFQLRNTLETFQTRITRLKGDLQRSDQNGNEVSVKLQAELAEVKRLYQHHQSLYDQELAQYKRTIQILEQKLAKSDARNEVSLQKLEQIESVASTRERELHNAEEGVKHWSSQSAMFMKTLNAVKSESEAKSRMISELNTTLSRGEEELKRNKKLVETRDAKILGLDNLQRTTLERIQAQSVHDRNGDIKRIKELERLLSTADEKITESSERIGCLEELLWAANEKAQTTTDLTSQLEEKVSENIQQSDQLREAGYKLQEMTASNENLRRQVEQDTSRFPGLLAKAKEEGTSAQMALAATEKKYMEACFEQESRTMRQMYIDRIREAKDQGYQEGKQAAESFQDVNSFKVVAEQALKRLESNGSQQDLGEKEPETSARGSPNDELPNSYDIDKFSEPEDMDENTITVVVSGRSPSLPPGLSPTPTFSTAKSKKRLALSNFPTGNARKRRKGGRVSGLARGYEDSEKPGKVDHKSSASVVIPVVESAARSSAIGSTVRPPGLRRSVTKAKRHSK